MERCRKYADAIRYAYGGFAGLIAIALMIISSDLENWWIFVGGCLFFALWFVVVFAYAAHLDAVAEQIQQNNEIISLLSRCNNASEVPAAEAKKENQKDSAAVADKPKDVAAAVKTTHTEDHSVPVKAIDDSKPGFVVCPLCGTQQRAGRQICFNCGAKFEL